MSQRGWSWMDQGEKHICWNVRAYPHLLADPWFKDSFPSRSVPFPSSPSLAPSLTLSLQRLSAENLALQRLSAGPFQSIPSALLRRGSAKIDVDVIQLASKAARFTAASRSAVSSTGMDRIRAAKDHCGRALDSFARSGTTSTFTLRLPTSPPVRFSWLAEWTVSEGPFAAAQNCVLGFVNQHRVHSVEKGLRPTANSCKAGLFVGALRIACDGLCTAARFDTAEENPGCLLGCHEVFDCLRHYHRCHSLSESFGRTAALVSHLQLSSTIYG